MDFTPANPVTGFLNLDKWSLQNPKFRVQSVDQIRVFLSFVEQYVDDRLPPDHLDARGRLVRLANERAFTRLVQRFLTGIPTTAAARQLWETAVRMAPRTAPARSCPPIFVDRAVGREFFALFQALSSDRERGRHPDPETTVFGYLIERLTRDELRNIVDTSLGGMPELEEVIASASASSARSPSSS